MKRNVLGVFQSEKIAYSSWLLECEKTSLNNPELSASWFCRWGVLALVNWAQILRSYKQMNNTIAANKGLALAGLLIISFSALNKYLNG